MKQVCRRARRDVRRVAVPATGAAADPGAEADPVRRRRAELHRQGLGLLRRPLGADVPRRLRGRRAQPGRDDPLRGAQRAGAHARRAGLRGLAGHGSADARARRAGRSPSTRTGRSAPSTSSGCPSPPSSATPTCCRRSTSPGIPRRAADRTVDHPVVVAGGHAAFNPEPVADFVDAAVLGDGEQAVLEISEVVRGLEGRGPPRRARRAAACGWRAPAASTCRRSTTSTTCPTGASSGSRPTAPACRGGSASTPSWTSTSGPTRSSRWCRWPSRCTSARRSRSSAAAPAAAGSARPA